MCYRTKSSNVLRVGGDLKHVSSNATTRGAKSLNASPVCVNTLLWRASVPVEKVPKPWVVEPPDKNNMDLVIFLLGN